MWMLVITISTWTLLIKGMPSTKESKTCSNGTWFEALSECATKNQTIENSSPCDSNERTWTGKILTPWLELKGCYTNLKWNNVTEVASPDVCFLMCTKFTYFGVMDNTCFCSNTIPTNVTEGKDCRPCTGKPRLLCGYNSFVPVYAINEGTYNQYQGTCMTGSCEEIGDTHKITLYPLECNGNIAVICSGESDQTGQGAFSKAQQLCVENNSFITEITTNSLICNATSRFWVNMVRAEVEVSFLPKGQIYSYNNGIECEVVQNDDKSFIDCTENAYYLCNTDEMEVTTGSPSLETTDVTGLTVTKPIATTGVTDLSSITVESSSVGVTQSMEMTGNTPTKESKRSIVYVIVGAAAGGGIVCLVLVIVLVCCICRTKKRRENKSSDMSGNEKLDNQQYLMDEFPTENESGFVEGDDDVTMDTTLPNTNVMTPPEKQSKPVEKVQIDSVISTPERFSVKRNSDSNNKINSTFSERNRKSSLKDFEEDDYDHVDSETFIDNKKREEDGDEDYDTLGDVKATVINDSIYSQSSRKQSVPDDDDYDHFENPDFRIQNGRPNSNYDHVTLRRNTSGKTGNGDADLEDYDHLDITNKSRQDLVDSMYDHAGNVSVVLKDMSRKDSHRVELDDYDVVSPDDDESDYATTMDVDCDEQEGDQINVSVEIPKVKVEEGGRDSYYTTVTLPDS